MRPLVVALILVGLMSPIQAGRAPAIDSLTATVIDADTGAQVWSKDADRVRPIASMTKLFVAMVVRRRGLKLDRWSEITRDDVRSARGGARSRLRQGEEFRNLDLLGAMMLVSDNRAPTALARSVGLDRAELIAAMNALARELGLKRTRFVDPTGIEENVSTAREMAIALRAALDDKVLARVMKKRHVLVTSRSREVEIEYRNTVAPLHQRVYPVRGGKTGHTEGAGYCMIVAAEIAGHPYVIALLGGPRKTTRRDDFARLAGWLAHR